MRGDSLEDLIAQMDSESSLTPNTLLGDSVTITGTWAKMVAQVFNGFGVPAPVTLPYAMPSEEPKPTTPLNPPVSTTVVAHYQLPHAQLTETFEAPELALPESDQLDPVRAWKRLRIDRPAPAEYGVGGTPFVRSRHSKKKSADLEQATCLKAGLGEIPCPHAPANGCTCGYYGWHDRDFEEVGNIGYGGMTYAPFLQYRNSDNIEPWAEVDLYGKVVAHVFGYRAEYQRIVAFHLEPSHALALHEWGFGNFNELANHLGAPIIYNGNEYK